MCMHCSQMCDRCKPPEMRALSCGSCGKATVLSRADCLCALGYWKGPEGKAGERGGDGDKKSFPARIAELT